MYLNWSSSHARLAIICPGIGEGIGAVGVSTVGAAGVKHGDIGGGTTESSRMSNGTGVASKIVEPTGIVEDHAEMAEACWMPSRMAEAIVIAEAVEMNEAIITPGACWVIVAIGLAKTSGMLVVMSIPSIKNNWNIGEALLFFTFKQ
jgi:hypothetical protein